MPVQVVHGAVHVPRIAAKRRFTSGLVHVVQVVQAFSLLKTPRDKREEALHANVQPQCVSTWTMWTNWTKAAL